MRIVLTILTVVYPLIVYLGLRAGFSSAVVWCVATAAGVKVFSFLETRIPNMPARLLMSVASMALVGAVGSLSSLFPLFIPSAINIFLCAIFILSLVYPPTMIERCAQRLEGPLPDAAKRYCQKVTIVWIVFFSLNGAVSLDSAFRSLEWWSLYNGLISYCAMGCIFGAELLVRRRLKKSMSVSSLITTGVVALSMILSLRVESYNNLSLALTQAHAESQTTLSLQEIKSNLTPPGPFRAAFTEQRLIAVLSKPLESQGEIVCVPSQGIIWNITKPVSQKSIITPRAIIRVDSNQVTERLHDGSQISSTLLSLLSGDLASAEESFNTSLRGSKNSWELTLTPKSSLTKEVLTTISITGAARPERIEVTHASGDKVITTFAEPARLSSKEEQDAREALYGAS